MAVHTNRAGHPFQEPLPPDPQELGQSKAECSAVLPWPPRSIGVCFARWHLDLAQCLVALEARVQARRSLFGHAELEHVAHAVASGLPMLHRHRRGFSCHGMLWVSSPTVATAVRGCLGLSVCVGSGNLARSVQNHKRLMRTTPRNVLLTLAGSQTLKAGVRHHKK